MDTPETYLAALTPDRRDALARVRALVNANLPEGVEEGMQYGMIGWFVPHARYPHGYHCDPAQPVPFAGLAAQKGHLALYLLCVYIDPERADWLRAEAARRGCTLDMGKACIRFRRAEELPLDLIAEAIRGADDFLARYEERLPASVKKKRAAAARRG